MNTDNLSNALEQDKTEEDIGTVIKKAEVTPRPPKKAAAKKSAAPKKKAAAKPSSKKKSVKRAKPKAKGKANEQEATLRRALLNIEAERATCLVIATTHGNIQVGTHKSPRIVVETTSSEDTLSGVSINVNRNKTVYADIKNRWRLNRFFSKNEVGDADLVVKIPADFAIDARSDSGSITIDGIQGAISVVTDKGDVTLDKVNSKSVKVRTKSGNVSGNVIAESAKCTTLSGDINLSGLGGPLTCKSGSGDMNLQWSSIPKVAKVDLRVGKGALNIKLPASAEINYGFVVGMAAIMNEFEQVPDSNFKIHVVSRNGPLSLQKSGG